MKILFITDNFPPEVNAPATRTYEHCKAWIEKGADITVITCAPNFPQGKVYKGFKNKLYHKSNIDGIEVIRVWSYISSNKGFSKRVLDYFSFACTSFGVGLFQKFDVVIATSPQFFTTWSASGLSFFKQKPWIFELRDLWPESINSVGAIKNKKIINTLEKIELFLYRDASKVIPVTDAFKRNLISRGIPSEKIDVITNGSNMELYKNQTKNISLLKKLNLEDKFIVGYIGTHGMAHSLDFIVNSITNIKDNSIHFLFIGDGAMKETIIDLAKTLNINNITFLDPIQKDEVPQYLSIIDVSLAPLKKSDTFKSVIPSKIFEAAAMKKPILLGVEGESQKIIEEFKSGLCFEPENEDDFIDKLMQLRNKVLYKSCQEGATRLAKVYDRKKLAQEMFHLIQDTIHPVQENSPRKSLSKSKNER